MKRKHFLSFMLTAGLAIPVQASFGSRTKSLENPPLKQPPFLKAGDTIGITSPAGFITTAEILPAIAMMESWGFKIKIGKTIDKRDFTMGGTDQERAADLQEMLDNPEIKAIMCARGGYGMVRIIDLLNFDRFLQMPKWIIGFSDVTVLHCHLNRQFGIASIHSKMCNSFPTDPALADGVQLETIMSIKKLLKGENLQYQGPIVSLNKPGKTEGLLLGGNLSIIETMAGTKSDLQTDGKILFVEDTGEYLYRLDRMFWNLKRTGKLANLAGLIIGGFKTKPDDPGEEFGKTIYDIVLEKVKGYGYPVAFDFPVGHQKNNFALKCGVKHSLEVGPNGSRLAAMS
ncbi:LD-carboxypeptidase [Pedobacter sp. N36a]|uniref:S66 peptidase family protein n=1 Tax=Pedobacter sp. N36a TaxID=2767996 RepID=UPI0016571EA3|nr:LD-carboxypeptidase [Pedobacter sp. N36a]MBC8985215.1 LD-carboxypeptidase [Pedobacter sp. N36a]